MNGWKHGTQLARFANGNVVETPFAEGRLDGSAIMRRPDGSVISAASGLFARDNPYRFARAARAGGEEALQKVLAETGSHINQPSLFPRNMGQGALYFAIEQDRPTADDDRDVQRTIEVLIEAGADVQFVNVTDWTNSTIYDTPLHQAASRNSIAAAIPLTAAGADVNALNDDGESPLHRAAGSNNTAVATLLIAAGADVNALDDDKESPLDHAVNTCVMQEVFYLRSGFDGDPETAAIIAMAGGRLNAPLGFGHILETRLWNRDEGEALLTKSMDRCYPPGIEWEKP